MFSLRSVVMTFHKIQSCVAVHDSLKLGYFLRKRKKNLCNDNFPLSCKTGIVRVILSPVEPTVSFKSCFKIISTLDTIISLHEYA